MYLTEQQQKAIKSLERAFKKCANAGLNFYGMDFTLLAMPEKAGNGYDESTINWDLARKSTEINTHGSYKDSGGF